jgi:endonuclease YncB( thermonuclease family)
VILVFATGLAVGYGLSRLDVEPPARAEQEQAADDDPYSAEVVRVVDGDDFEILWRPPVPVRFKVRLVNAIAPYGERDGVKEATETLASMVYGKQIKLDFNDPQKIRQDRSGRLLAIVEVDGKIVNVEMVRSGWATHFVKYGEGRHGEALKAAQAEAIDARRGLHAEP